MNPQGIETLEQAWAFVQYLMVEEGINFHPDRPFEKYINQHTGQPLYSDGEASMRTTLLDQCLDLGEELDIDMRDVLIDMAQKVRQREASA